MPREANALASLSYAADVQAVVAASRDREVVRVKLLMLGGPRHGETIDPRGSSVVVVPVERRDSYAMFGDHDFPTSIRLETLMYERRAIGFFGQRRDVLVCASDFSSRTAESYMGDVLGRLLDDYVAKR